jgi:hypothetical protein
MKSVKTYGTRAESEFADDGHKLVESNFFNRQIWTRAGAFQFTQVNRQFY